MSIIEEIADDLAQNDPHQKILTGTATVFSTNSVLNNPIISDYAIEKANFSPDGRHGHSSVLLGDYLYVFGGVISGVCTNDLFKLDIRNDIWTKVVSVINPSARAFSVMLRKGNLIYLHGGVSYSYTIENLPLDNDPQVAFNLPPSNNIKGDGKVISETQKTYLLDTFVLNTQTDQWSLVNVSGSTPRAYSCGFIIGNFFCVMSGLTTGNSLINSKCAYFDTTIANKVWTEATDSTPSFTATPVWGHNCILIGNTVYRFYGITNGTLTTAATPYTSVIRWTVNTTTTTLSLSSGLQILEPTNNRTATSFANRPAFYFYFSLYYDGTDIRLINGVNYSSISVNLTTPPIYYKAASGNTGYYFNFGATNNTNSMAVMSTTNNVISGSTYQNWISKTSNYLTTPLIGQTLNVNGTELLFFGGRDLSYTCSGTFRIFNTVVATYTPVYINVGSDTFTANGFTFKVVRKNGKVYVLITLNKSMKLTLYSLRILGS